MKWKAKDKTEAGSILRLLATQGEPLLKKLDEGVKVDLLQRQSRAAALKYVNRSRNAEAVAT